MRRKLWLAGQLLLIAVLLAPLAYAQAGSLGPRRTGQLLRQRAASRNEFSDRRGHASARSHLRARNVRAVPDSADQKSHRVPGGHGARFRAHRKDLRGNAGRENGVGGGTSSGRGCRPTSSITRAVRDQASTPPQPTGRSWKTRAIWSRAFRSSRTRWHGPFSGSAPRRSCPTRARSFPCRRRSSILRRSSRTRKPVTPKGDGRRPRHSRRCSTGSGPR